MMPGENPFRRFITLLLIAALPLCCCDVRLLLGGGAMCRAVAVDAEAAVSGCCQHDEADETASDQGERGPADPGDGCACAKTRIGASATEPPAISHSDAVVALLD